MNPFEYILYTLAGLAICAGCELLAAMRSTANDAARLLAAISEDDNENL
jgi:hypothetical protein